jgi:hypothetical protein
VGGIARLDIDNGRVELTGRSLVWSGSSGGFGATGGEASGSSSTVRVVNGGVLTSANPEGVLEVLADGRGGEGTVRGGTGRGGNSRIETDGTGTGSTISLSGATVSATGSGGFLEGISSQGAGAGIGGQATVQMGNAGDSWTFGTLDVDASGLGGSFFNVGSGPGGSGIGGTAILNATAGQLVVTESLEVSASGTARAGNGGAGATGRGGRAEITAATGARVTCVVCRGRR